MVFLADLSGIESTITYAIFGVQYQTRTSKTNETISTLYNLLSKSTGRVDCLKDEDHGISKPGPKTTTFVAYWLRSDDYKTWSASKPVQEFWNNLPDDAGVWKEVMTVPKSRYMFAASQPIKWGLAEFLELKDSEDQGYWGVYRHRLAGNPDSFTDPEDQFTSAYVTSAKTNANGDLPVLDIPKVRDETVIPGRVKLTNVPDNIIFVREGQRQRNIPKEEHAAWLEQISPHARSWITHLDEERSKNGVIAFTTHVEDTSQVPNKNGVDSTNGEDVKSTAETDQLAWFLDLAHFERAGRSHKGHVELRKTVMTLYGPGGKLSTGKAELYVELCVLKKGDLEAEYIGCTAGTGLLYLRNL